MDVLIKDRVDPTEREFGARCMHGPEECAGNVQQLCVAKYQPSLVWWDFVQCQNWAGRQDIGKPSLASKCAKTLGFDWEGSEVSYCAGQDGNGKSAEGAALLRESIELGHKLGIE